MNRGTIKLILSEHVDYHWSRDQATMAASLLLILEFLDSKKDFDQNPLH